ncbi:hypothetical protein FEM48_Zijuj07G0163600 [Ziziphus jujuba var. spinosa]|uniref:Disease resistance R13L4/SHOC-2-like LRR domain-containing protein n=1 Tax=Ziziphus jujuba var. spinosa TaxID=714518 RepID=A0A978V5P0_ZIZJJ|nr:hypothetical protein FEM48_Zijuj07G0163600 [Ziziphus jujuba var. spinosa]
MGLPNLERWWQEQHPTTTSSSQPASFRILERLVIEDCPKLCSMPLYFNLEDYLVLDNTSFDTFRQTINQSWLDYFPLFALRSLCIIGIKKLDITQCDKIRWDRLAKLRFLRLDYLPKLDKLPDGLQHLTFLERLHIWRCIINTLPEWIGNFTHLRTLGISVCIHLKSLPQALASLSNLETLEILQQRSTMTPLSEGRDPHGDGHYEKQRSQTKLQCAWLLVLQGVDSRNVGELFCGLEAISELNSAVRGAYIWIQLFLVSYRLHQMACLRNQARMAILLLLLSLAVFTDRQVDFHAFQLSLLTLGHLNLQLSSAKNGVYIWIQLACSYVALPAPNDVVCILILRMLERPPTSLRVLSMDIHKCFTPCTLHFSTYQMRGSRPIAFLMACHFSRMLAGDGNLVAGYLALRI